MSNKKKVWKTREGKEIEIKNMTDSHLMNTIKFLRRNANANMAKEIASAYSAASLMQGEMAIDAIERDIRIMEETSPDEYLQEFPIYNALIKEAEKRNLLATPPIHRSEIRQWPEGENPIDYYD
jgi:hypothetical protein